MIEIHNNINNYIRDYWYEDNIIDCSSVEIIELNDLNTDETNDLKTYKTNNVKTYNDNILEIKNKMLNYDIISKDYLNDYLKSENNISYIQHDSYNDNDEIVNKVDESIKNKMNIYNSYDNIISNNYDNKKLNNNKKETKYHTTDNNGKDKGFNYRDRKLPDAECNYRESTNRRYYSDTRKYDKQKTHKNKTLQERTNFNKSYSENMCEMYKGCFI